jgi:hypothetical protein
LVGGGDGVGFLFKKLDRNFLYYSTNNGITGFTMKGVGLESKYVKNFVIYSFSNFKFLNE